MATIYAAGDDYTRRALESFSPIITKAIEQYNEYKKLTDKMWGEEGLNATLTRALEDWKSSGAGAVAQLVSHSIQAGPLSDRLREQTEALLKVYPGSSQEQAGQLAYYMTLLGQDAPPTPLLPPQALEAAVAFCEEVQAAEPVSRTTAATAVVEMPVEFGEELDALIAEVTSSYTGDRHMEADYLCAVVTVSVFAAFICLLTVNTALVALGFLFWDMLNRSRNIGDAAKKRFEEKFPEE
ncbi:hypothetical protein ACEZDB_12035 [Streptacidiphilus sp. N1-3]|uniref:Uncharacterized protein n=1 Tax=Streptacidiphilus alkalitolerans TaxID=3342712 RepID=A0ABV6WZB2_9ACTN